ncbi:hypothetical protein [Bacillus sp. SN10]|nr:hypothetical protein [Bacillus sp. SN10]
MAKMITTTSLIKSACRKIVTIVKPLTSYFFTLIDVTKTKLK